MLIYLFSFFLQPLSGAFDSYYQVVLRNNGYSQSLIGVIIAIGSLSTVILPFVAAFAVEKIGKEKHIMFVGVILAAIAMIPVVLGAPVLITAVSLFMAMGMRWTANSLSDGYVNSQINNDNAKYGSIRGAGTLGYVVFMILYSVTGFPNKDNNFQILLNVFLSVFLFCLVLILCPKSKQKPAQTGKKEKLFDFKWFDKSFYMFVLTIGISRIAMGAIDKLLASYINEELGLGQWFTAVVALGATAEFFMLVFGAKFAAKHKITPFALVALSCVGLYLRLFLYASTNNVLVFLFAQTLHACAFGACHLAGNIFLTKHVNAEHLSLAFVIYWTMGYNLPELLGAFFGGFIIDALGYRSLFGLYTMFPVIGLILCIIFRKRFGNK